MEFLTVIMEKTNPQPENSLPRCRQHLKEQDLALLISLRRNAREKLTTISRKTHIPVSTLHDKLKSFLDGMIEKHTTLLNYESLGYTCHAHLLLRAAREHKDALRQHLSSHPNVNSAFKINNGWNFLVDVVFPGLDALDNFLDDLENRFAVTDHQVHYIIDEIKRESFLTDELILP